MGQRVETVLWGFRGVGVSVALALALILYAIRALNYPFDGLAQVGPEAFEAALSKMEAQRGR